ncbi:MAG: hypothetical protein M3O01_05120 [Pseudomonadota bacterium]|nr:hypothetical protein [Pseudomonadota bacterium]
MNPRSTQPRAIRPMALVLSLSLLLSHSAHAADPEELERRLAQSLQLIEALTRRLERVEGELAATKAPATPASVPATAAASAPPADARIEQLERTMDQLTASSGRDLRDAGLALHGFADVGLAQTRHLPAGQKDGVAVGTVDFYLTPEFGANVKTLVELNFGTADNGHTQVDLERAQIGYAFSDALTVWLGRFHTPFGYWNMAYHHGAQIQPSILRPRMLDFEDDGGILPVHTTGAWAAGSARFGADKLSYNFYIGNGSRIIDGQLNPNPGGDDNRNKAVGFGLNYRFGGPSGGVTWGLNGLRQTVDAHGAADAVVSTTRMTMLGTHAVYEDDKWQVIGEYYRLRDLDLSGPTGEHNSWTGYAHVGYTFDDRWGPYYRLEKAALDQNDNYFLAQQYGRSYLRHVLGVRYNVDPGAVVKVELVRTDDHGLGYTTDQLRLQYAVGF